MKFFKGITVLIVLLLSAGSAFSAQAKAVKYYSSYYGREIEVAEGEILVKFRESGGLKAVSALSEGKGCSVVERIDGLNVYKIRIAEGSTIDDMIIEYKKNPEVIYAGPNHRCFALEVPNDPNYDLQWGLPDISAPEGWDIETGDSNIIIAIVDTGVDLDHPDLEGKIPPDSGYDFVNDSSLADDDNGHGTHVAGIAAASSNNQMGVTGVSWNSYIMPIKVLDSAGLGWEDDIASGIIFAADTGARVINLSLGGYVYMPTVEDAVNYAHELGCVVCAAMGNDSDGTLNYPAVSTNTIAVGSISSSGQRSGFSNYGSHIDLVAPGNLIYSCYNNGAYAYDSGTSMATPHVSGLCALLLSWNSSLTPAEVKTAMCSTADDVTTGSATAGWDIYTGSGTINVYAALSSVPEGLPDTNTAKIGNNCFDPTTGSKAVIYYDVSETDDGAAVTIKVYNMIGEEIVTLVNGAATDSGSYSVEWDGDNSLNEVVGSGVYFVSVRVGSEVNVSRVMVIK